MFVGIVHIGWKGIICWVLLFINGLTIPLFAQLSENFEDSLFSFAPEWKGDTANFKINQARQLQLSAPYEEGTSYLVIHSKAIINAE